MSENVIDTGSKSTITHTPTVDEVSDFILAGNGVDALNDAMSQLVDERANWELDVAKESVPYTVKAVHGYYDSNGSGVKGDIQTVGDAACALSLIHI